MWLIYSDDRAGTVPHLKFSGKAIFMGLSEILKLAKSKPTAAVILAAGSGQRFSDIAGEKQNCDLFDMPVILRTVLAFEKCGVISEIVVVCRKEDNDDYRKMFDEQNITKLTTVTAGGSTRAESSLIGFECISDKAKFVAIHDGARCLVTPEMIEGTVREAWIHGAAAAGHASTDTVKYSEDGMFITETVDRSKVWLIGTPQVFMTNMYRAAAYMAKKDGAAVTDDCMMAERLGFKVRLVEVGTENIKITTKSDIYAAEGILKMRDERGDAR